MKLCYFALFLLIFVILMPIGYGFDVIDYDGRHCNTSFDGFNTTVKLEIYGIDEFKPYLIANTQAIYSYEITSMQYKIDLNEVIKGQIDVVCDGVIIPNNNNKNDYRFVKIDSEIKNSVKYHLNGTFNVPQNARYCEARGRIYGVKITESYSEKNNECYIYDIEHLDGNEVERKDVWTREEYFMKKWSDVFNRSIEVQRELSEKSREDQRIQNITYVLITLLAVILGSLGAYFAQKAIYNKKLMMEHNEKIYAHILKSIDFSKEKLINFLPIYKDLISWGPNEEERLNNDYDYWIDIRDSPRSIILKTHDEELYNMIDNFFEKSTTKYNQLINKLKTRAISILLNEISKIKMPATHFELNTNLEINILISSILKKKTPYDESITIGFQKDKTIEYTKIITLTRQELKKIRPQIEKLDEFKLLKKERKIILEDVEKIKKEIEDYLNLRRTLEKDVNKFKNWLNNGFKYFLSKR